MNWKEFLKPNKKKIITFVILLALSIVYSFIVPSVLCTEDIGVSFCYGTPSMLSIFLFWPVNLAIQFLWSLGPIHAIKYAIEEPIYLILRILLILIAVVGNLLYLYTISTLILKLVEKFKKKRIR